MVILFYLVPLLLVFRKSANKYFGLLFMFILILIQGLRVFDMDNDTKNYLLWYEYGIPSIIMQFGDEPLYALINILCIKLNLGFQWVLIIMSTISYSCIYWAARNLKIKPFNALLYYVLLSYYSNSFNLMRQFTADSILLLSFSFLYLKEIKKYLIFLVLAALMHKSAYIGIVPLFFAIKKLNINEFVLTVVLFVSLIIGVTPFMFKVSDVIGKSLNLYGASDHEGIVSSVSLSKIAMNILYIYLYHILKKDSLLLKITLLGVVIFNLMSYSVTSMRLAYGFLVMQTLLFNKLELEDKYISNKKLVMFVCTFYMVFVYYYFLSSNNGDVLNYRANPISSLF